MSKTILENYLFLLTEDPEMDALDQEYKSSRAKLLKLGSGPEGHDALSSKYMNIPSDKIPPEHRQKMSDFRKAKDEFEKISNKRTQYSKWVRSGSKGPKPWEYEEIFRKAEEDIFRANERMRKAREDIFRTNEKYRRTMEKINRSNRIISTTVYVLYALVIASYIYKYYFSIGDNSCSLLFGKKKEKCKIEYKIKAYKKQQDHLRKSLLNSNKTSDPKKSKQKIQNKIIEIEKNIKNLEDRLKELNV
jgi:hypothetical protein